MKKLMMIGSIAIAATLFAAAPETVEPIPLGGAANTSRIDKEEADGKGGWLDLGYNDLHVLKAGKLEFCGVNFEIPEAGDENSKNCVVLGRGDLKGSRFIDIAADSSGDTFYLLHAAADVNTRKGDVVGYVVMHYADDSTQEYAIKAGRDIGKWTSAMSFRASFKAWTEYNHNTQVSLFASKYAVDPAKTLKRVELRYGGKGKWMVVAAARGGDRELKALISPLTLTDKYSVPSGFAATPKAVPAGQKPKNVILIIGDGMGEGTVRFASSYCRGNDNAMLMQQLPVYGHCRTVSVEGKTTDSAAAATAIATGNKTMNHMIGLRATSDAERKTATRVISFAERGHQQGLAVGLMSDDGLYAATPAGFYAHVKNRGETSKIAKQAMASGYEVLIGRSASAWAFEKLPKTGYTQIAETREIASVPKDSKVLGFLQMDKTETAISETLAAVIDRLDATGKRYFLMAECATPDHGNHANNPRSTVFGAVQTDWMTKVAVDYAMKRGDTLVIVTADHETGGVSTEFGKDGKPRIVYSACSHTERPVALYAYGPGAELFQGEIENTDICKKLTKLLDVED